MKIKEYATRKIRKNNIGSRLLDDKRYRAIIKAVFSLMFNLIFVFYNGILGITSGSLIFVASAVYYLLLSSMRFSVIRLERKYNEKSDIQSATVTGILLIILSVVFHIIILFSIKYNTATSYGQITMIAIATFTFTKITVAIVTAVKHRRDNSRLIKAINNIRYSEVAVSLLTMQQSMLVSFGEMNKKTAIILNACTGAGVCVFIMTLGIITLLNIRKEN